MNEIAHMKTKSKQERVNMNDLLNPSSCCFCGELATGMLAPEFQKKVHAQSRIIAETDLFAMFPTISPLCKGHVLIAPKRHVQGLLQLEKYELLELINFVSHIESTIRPAFDSVIIFEHGVGEEQKGGCGVDHAHLHMLPMSSSEAGLVEATIQKEYELRPVTDIRNVASQMPRNSSYMFFGTGINSVRWTQTENIPSQYMRKVIAELRRLDAWDWREAFGWADVRSTMEHLTACAQEYRIPG